jgi:hypothetical protein
MDEGWFDLSGVSPIANYAINTIHTITDDGSGRALLISLAFLSGDELGMKHFLMEPDLAGEMGFTMLGLVHDYPLADFDPNEHDEDDET